MFGVLGIDAAWTEKEPSGVALLEGSPGEWRCVAVTPSYDSFLNHAEGVLVDWAIKSRGAVLEVGPLLEGAKKLLGGQDVAIVAVDMPLSITPITRRRVADDAISRSFGGKGASTHTPNVDRPGVMSTQLRDGFAAAGFPLATSTTPAGTSHRLIEVYPHPALLTLTGASRRLPYKVNNSGKYWKRASLIERRANLLHQFRRILAALSGHIHDIELELPEPADEDSLSALKRYEDSLDALVCAWVGTRYLENDAVPYGDNSAAIWVPRGAHPEDLPTSDTPTYYKEHALPSTSVRAAVEGSHLAGDFEYFMDCLTQAGRKLDSHYFRIDVAGSDGAVFRERVYCYELYHQLRNALGDNFPYKLDGELDKVSHRKIEPAVGAKKPDFVVHEPGEMNRNLVVVEVKSLSGAQANNVGGLTKDLDTLRGFLNQAQYHRAVMLVYGDGRRELPPSIVTKVEEVRTQDERILLVWHSGPGEKPKVVLG